MNSNENWREQLSVGDSVLVVDIGGGTTDISLVSVLDKDGNLTLERTAVGSHLLLGGDNMDLALAYVMKGGASCCRIRTNNRFRSGSRN